MGHAVNTKSPSKAQTFASRAAALKGAKAMDWPWVKPIEVEVKGVKQWALTQGGPADEFGAYISRVAYEHTVKEAPGIRASIRERNKLLKSGKIKAVSIEYRFKQTDNIFPRDEEANVLFTKHGAEFTGSGSFFDDDGSIVRDMDFDVPATQVAKLKADLKRAGFRIVPNL